MKTDGIQFSLGFMKSTPIWRFGSPRAFGAPGADGTIARRGGAQGVMN